MPAINATFVLYQFNFILCEHSEFYLKGWVYIQLISGSHYIMYLYQCHNIYTLNITQILYRLNPHKILESSRSNESENLVTS